MIKSGARFRPSTVVPLYMLSKNCVGQPFLEQLFQISTIILGWSCSKWRDLLWQILFLVLSRTMASLEDVSFPILKIVPLQGRHFFIVWGMYLILAWISSKHQQRHLEKSNWLIQESKTYSVQFQDLFFVCLMFLNSGPEQCKRWQLGGEGFFGLVGAKNCPFLGSWRELPSLKLI